ncbi:hypothetical protein MLD38_000166 [Melastoma candidum]|uniref:Uncharacterized protein n=1 Tax=Melastoma candidum TaxID=119954 RepID=A0ACB9S988_9MYRT|nr:hypothetical protein MLD38_000166 [Melastoma candidum]
MRINQTRKRENASLRIQKQKGPVQMQQARGGQFFGQVAAIAMVMLQVLIFLAAQADSRQVKQPKPDPQDAVATARWLVSQNVWGVLNTIADDLGGAPFGNVVSFSDGLPNKGTGVPYFYLTTLDPTAKYALKDERASFTASEYPVGTCRKIDPENPTCAKITLMGKLKILNGSSEEAEFGQNALFTKHPEMKNWPKEHGFQVYKLTIENIFMIDWFGGPKPITPDQYLHPNKSRNTLDSPLWK